ncbi:MAG: hypothetical protein FWD48_02930 [Oscillospiraceae bacterium]|nr:hypothetical protein [Oscillospiraceae bacterium]
MKNHVKVDGKLLQTNKKWSQLKSSQQHWICEQIKAEHVKFIEQNNCLPWKNKKAEVLDSVWKKILEREIWIPRYEYERNAGKMIDRLNRKCSLFTGEKE